MKLRDLQLQFKDYLLNNNLAIEQAIVAEKDINAAERLAIYKDGCLQLYIDLLAADFPHLKLLLKDEFETEVERYVTEYPAKHYLLHYLGKDLALFFEKNQKPLLWQEMAKLEYAIIEITDKKNEDALTLKKLSVLPADQWASIKFALCDAVVITEFASAAPFLWLDKQKKNPTKTTWLIWRKDFQIHLKLLTKEEMFILQLIQQQKDFIEICNALGESMPEEQAGQYLMRFLTQCLDDKLLKDF